MYKHKYVYTVLVSRSCDFPPGTEMGLGWGQCLIHELGLFTLVFKVSEDMLCGEVITGESTKASLRPAYLSLMSAWTVLVHTRSHGDLERIPFTGVIREARALNLCVYTETLTSVPRSTRLRLCFTCLLYLPYTLLFDLFWTRSSLTIPSYTSFLSTTSGYSLHLGTILAPAVLLAPSFDLDISEHLHLPFSSGVFTDTFLPTPGSLPILLPLTCLRNSITWKI